MYKGEYVTWFRLEAKNMHSKKTIAFAIAIIFLATPIILPRANTVSTSKSLTPSAPIRVACVGDSITQITNYTADLQTMLGANYTVGNFGVSGSTVTINSYKPYIDQPQFHQALDFNPNYVVIMLGTNDAHSYLEQYSSSFESNYDNLINSFQNLTSDPQILVVKSPPIYNNSLDLSPTFFGDTIIPHIQSVAHQENLPTVDVYDAFGNQSNLTVDGVHPNDDGSSIIASQVYNAITSYDYSALTGSP